MDGGGSVVEDDKQAVLFQAWLSKQEGATLAIP
jgi:hypothetical protein